MVLSDKQFKYLILNPYFALNFVDIVLNFDNHDKPQADELTRANNNTLLPCKKEFISDGRLIYQNIDLWIEYQIRKTENIAERFNLIKSAFKLIDCNVGDNYSKKNAKVCLFITWFNYYKKVNGENFFSKSRDTDCSGNITDENFCTINIDLETFKKLRQENKLNDINTVHKQLGEYFLDPFTVPTNIDPRVRVLYDILFEVENLLKMKRKWSATDTPSEHLQELRILKSLLKKDNFKTVFPTLSDDDIENCKRTTGSSSDEVGVSLPKRKRVEDERKTESTEKESESTEKRSESTVKEGAEQSDQEGEELSEYKEIMQMSYVEALKYMSKRGLDEKIVFSYAKLLAPVFSRSQILKDIKENKKGNKKQNAHRDNEPSIERKLRSSSRPSSMEHLENVVIKDKPKNSNINPKRDKENSCTGSSMIPKRQAKKPLGTRN